MKVASSGDRVHCGISEIVRRGHEAAAHGRVWDNSYQLPRDEEKRFIADSVETIHKVTGQTPVGWNAYWMRNSIYILETLQNLGFLYQIDEPSHDEPFIIRCALGSLQSKCKPHHRRISARAGAGGILHVLLQPLLAYSAEASGCSFTSVNPFRSRRPLLLGRAGR
jgi:peptidoglycan/xylan/chitin deacetylase (PgdA/CDA1 family)